MSGCGYHGYSARSEEDWGPAGCCSDDEAASSEPGDEESLAAWRCLCATSRKEYAKIYDLLSIENLEERGESFYNDMLKGVVEDLEEQVRCSEERSDELATRQFRSLFGCASSSSLDIHNTITTA